MILYRYTKHRLYICSENIEASQNSRRQKGDINQVSYWGPSNIRLQGTYLLHSSWEANRFSASQEIPRILWNPKYIIVFTPIPFLSLISVIKDRSLPEAMYQFRNKASFYGEELLARCPTPEMDDHPLSVVRDCLSSIFVATLHVPPSATWLRAMPWW